MYYGQPSGCCTTVIILLTLAICVLTGCKTKEYVYIEKTDTLLVHQTDTVKETQIKVERKDSIVHDSVVEIRDVEGKTIYKEVWRDRFVNVYKSDSVDKYRAMYDSLLSVKSNVEIKEKVVTKTNYSGWWAFGGLLLIMVITAYLVWRFKPK